MENSLSEVISNINQFNSSDQVAEALKEVSDNLDTSTATTVVGEIGAIIEKQGSMSVSELKSTRQDLAMLKEKVRESDRISERDRENILSLISNQEQVINQNTTLSKRAAEFVTENIKNKIPDIAGIAAGVLSESPAAALGVKFIGDKIQENREKRRAEKEERAARLKRIADQEALQEQEYALLRASITNEETLAKAGMDQATAAANAMSAGLEYQQYIDDLKNELIRDSKEKKLARDLEQQSLKELNDIRDKFGLEDTDSPVSLPPSTPTPEDNVSAPSVTGEFADRLQGIEEQLTDGSPYLKSIRDFLEYMSDPDTGNSFDVENAREQRRLQSDQLEQDIKIVEELEEQTKLLKKIHKEQNDDLKENILANMAGGIVGNIGKVAGAIGTAIAGALGLGGLSALKDKVGLGGGTGADGKKKPSTRTRARKPRGRFGRIGALITGATTFGGSVLGKVKDVGKTALSKGKNLVKLGAAAVAGSGVVAAGKNLMSSADNVSNAASDATKTASRNLTNAAESASKGTQAVAKATPKPTAMTNMADNITGTGSQMADGPKVSTTPKTPSVDKPVSRVRTPPKAPALAKGADAIKSSVMTLKSNVKSAGAAALDTKLAKKILATKGAKLLGKQLPLIGAAAGGIFALSKLFQGDFVGAGAEAGGIFLPSVAGLPLDAAIMARETYNEMFGTPDNPFPLEGDLISKPEIAKQRMDSLTEMAKEAVGLAQGELDKQAQIQQLQTEMDAAADRISRSEGGENVYWGRDSKGIEEDQKMIETNQAKIDALQSSPADQITPQPQSAGGQSAAEMLEMSRTEGVGANEMLQASQPQEKLSRAEFINQSAVNQETGTKPQTQANIVDAKQTNVSNNRTTVVGTPSVRNPDPTMAYTQAGLRGGVF